MLVGNELRAVFAQISDLNKQSAYHWMSIIVGKHSYLFPEKRQYPAIWRHVRKYHA